MHVAIAWCLFSREKLWYKNIGGRGKLGSKNIWGGGVLGFLFRRCAHVRTRRTLDAEEKKTTQKTQNLVIRESCKLKNFQLELSSAEYIMENSYLVLNNLLEIN